MSRQDWKFLSPLPNGTPSDTPIASGDLLQVALYKLQGQINPVKDRTGVLEDNVQGSALIDLTGFTGTYNMTLSESRKSLVIFNNNDDSINDVSFYDTPDAPVQMAFFNCSSLPLDIRISTADNTITLPSGAWTLIAYGYTLATTITVNATVLDGNKGDITVSGTGATWTLNSGVVTKTTIGLGNVDNTSDVNKPISTATQTALNSKVDNTTTVNGYALSSNVTLSKSDLGLSNVDNTSDVNKPISTATQTALNAKEATANKGAANGYAPLDSNAKVPVANLPDSIVGALKFKGTWNATTDVITSSDGIINGQPIPAASSSNEGWYFIVAVAGSTNKSGITDWKIGDWILSNGTAWQKIDNTDSVSSVNGLTGTVTLTTANVADSTDKRYVTDAEKTKLSNLSGTNTGDQTITLTSDVAGSGTGSFATTIQPNVVSNSKLAQVSTQTFKGRITAGTGNVEDLTVAQATSMLNAVVGDSGSGGTKGLVPAPVTGDANKVLVGAGTFNDLGAVINNATAKTTPVDNDMFSIMDSAASNILKKLSWANIKATMKAYMDTLYLALPGTNGIAVRTGATTAVARTLQAVTGLTTISNGDGVSGDPSIGVSLSNSNVNDATDYTTTSATYVTLGAPIRLSGLAAGTWLVFATSCVGSSSSNADVWMGIHSGTAGSTTLATGGEMLARPAQTVGINGVIAYEVPITCHGIVTITAGQVIEPKWKTSGGTATVYQTTMHAIRIA